MSQQQIAEMEYRAIFEATGDGIIVVDQESGRVVDVNPALCRMAGYSHDELVGMDPRLLVHPSSRASYDERVRGHEISALEDRVSLVGVRRDGSLIDIELQVRTFYLRGKRARLAVVRDVTERVHAFELLEQRVRERTGELSAILEVTHAVNSTLELQPLLGLVLERLGSIVEFSDAAILLLEDDMLCISDYRGSRPRDQVVGIRMPAGDAVVFQAVMEQNGPVIVDDLNSDSPIAVAYRDWAARAFQRGSLSARSVLAVPLIVRQQVIGQLRLDHEQVNFYRRRHADLAVTFANQAAAAIANARLFQSERRTRESLQLALDAGQMGTWEWVADTGQLTWSPQLEVLRGLTPGTFAQTYDASFADIHPDDAERVRHDISLSARQDVHHIEFRIIRSDGSLRWLESRGQVVRDADGRATGMRGVCMDVTARKEAEEQRNQSLARERAAVEAQAALEERHKLARELHDSVSQALYGIGITAQTARSALEVDHDVAGAAEAVESVILMSDAGLAEMRALISELRPESLAKEGLIVALERHVASVRARYRLQVITELTAEPDVPAAAKEALYRIAREALHNTVKHARARSVSLSLRRIDGSTIMEIADDGLGFDPTGDYPGHLGLASMAERAREAGGELTIESSAGSGTRVIVQLPSAS